MPKERTTPKSVTMSEYTTIFADVDDQEGSESDKGAGTDNQPLI
jgi:hypothetical protein